MPEIGYLIPLEVGGLNWLRFELMTVGGVVMLFVAQYETMLDGKVLPVVRYDNHHGFCHRDRLNRRGDVVEKTPIGGSPGEVATLGANDIRANWEAYLEQFLGDAE
ncbi:MAG: hypothetical protein QM692_24785 [Thermomicrobiales bacterium]